MKHALMKMKSVRFSKHWQNNSHGTSTEKPNSLINQTNVETFNISYHMVLFH